jgi:hypothetical protein
MEAAEAYCNVLSWHFLGGTEKSRIEPQDNAPNFQPETIQKRCRLTKLAHLHGGNPQVHNTNLSHHENFRSYIDI